MKKKIVIIIVLATLMISTASVSAINIIKTERANTVPNENLIPTEEVDMHVADLIINSKNTHAEITIDDNVKDLNIPNGETTVAVTFIFNCKITNEKYLNTETWVFKIHMRKYPAGQDIINWETTKNDEIIEGYPWEKEISETVVFSRDYPWEEWGATDDFEQRYSMSLRCEYYDDGVKPGEQAPDDHDAEYDRDVVIELQPHNPPSKPEIISSDINNGGKHCRGTYSIKVQSDDPEGDDIRYTFKWANGEYTQYPSSTGYTESGTQATSSYTYGEEYELDKEYTIEIYTMDEFGRMSDITKLTFTLPKAKTFINTEALRLLFKNIPQFNNILEILS